MDTNEFCRAERHGYTDPSAETAQARVRGTRRYSAPRILVLGDVRGTVLGGSPGVGDSGPGGTVRKPPG